MLVLLLAACAASCRRRVPGQCQDHVECEAGFDCVEGRCVRRAAFPGATAEQNAGSAGTTPAETDKVPDTETTPAPLASPDAADGPRAPLPKKVVPAPKPAPPDPVTPPPTPPTERLPLYKQRLKNG